MAHGMPVIYHCSKQYQFLGLIGYSMHVYLLLACLFDPRICYLKSERLARLT